MSLRVYKGRLRANAIAVPYRRLITVASYLPVCLRAVLARSSTFLLSETSRRLEDALLRVRQLHPRRRVRMSSIEKSVGVLRENKLQLRSRIL